MAFLFAIDQPSHHSFPKIELKGEFIPFAYFSLHFYINGGFIIEDETHGSRVGDTAWIEIAKGVVLKFFGEDSEDNPVIIQIRKYLNAETGFLSSPYALLKTEYTRLACLLCDVVILDFVIDVLICRSSRSRISNYC